MAVAANVFLKAKRLAVQKPNTKLEIKPRVLPIHRDENSSSVAQSAGRTADTGLAIYDC